MITIVAEKPDVGNKIAAALDKITLKNGKNVDFASLKANENAVKAQQTADGYLKIQWDGQDCYVTWGYWHLCGLQDVPDYNPEYKTWRSRPMPFLPESYKLQLAQSSDKTFAARQKKQFQTIKDLMNKSDYVINATDFDREGEVIFAYIYEMAKCKKPVKRACFSSQTKEGLRQGFTKDLKPGSSMKNTEEAGRMRGIADWAVGTNLTVAITLKRPGTGVLSVGRVQTPTLAMIVSKELAIRNFTSEPYWTIDAEFETVKKEKFKAKYSQEKIKDRKEAESIYAKVTGQKGSVKNIEKKLVKKSPPLLYSLSALQMDANSKFGYSLNETLEVAQKLYDSGCTTYPRTNSQYLTEDMEPVVNDVLDKLSSVTEYAPLINGKSRTYDFEHYFNNAKVESHFAIIPTGAIPSGLAEKERNVYDLICRSVIKMLYKEAVLEQTKVFVDVRGEEFTASGSIVKDPGWMAVGDASKTELLPELKTGDILSGTYNLLDKKTEPPKRYTEKTLLAAMLSAGKDLPDAELKKIMSDPKTGGIGTEATRAAIVETLLVRGYIKRDKKSITATEKGIDLIQNLPVEEIKSAELTAQWEKRLGDIARGSETADSFRRDFENAVRKWVNEIDSRVSVASVPVNVKTLKAVCPKCGKPIRETPFGYGCTGWVKDGSGCSWSIGKICGKKLSITQVETLLNTKRTSHIKNFTSKAGKKFDAALVLNEDGSIGFDFK